MKLSREAGLNLLALALLVALAVWFASRTEWVDIWVRTPAKAEALTDPYYASKQLLRRLGAKVVAPDNLDRLPPSGATLVLASQQWNLFDERDGQLKRWVEAGGHLVLPDAATFGEEVDWVPIHLQRHKFEPDPKAPTPPIDASFKPGFVGPRHGPEQACPLLMETAGRAGAFGAPRGYRLCAGSPFLSLQSKAPALWSIDDVRGPQILRVGLGQGSVSAAVASYALLQSHSLFHGDHALAMVALLQANPGREIWFVVNESRAALPLWLWQRTAPAIVLAMLVLVFALWRGAIRFGPMAPQALAARRSVAEQIRGSAAFILRRGGAPLLDAARRALIESARKRLPGLAHMGLEELAAAIAKASALPAPALQSALDTRLPAKRRDLPARLALLETARRRLDAGPLV